MCRRELGKAGLAALLQGRPNTAYDAAAHKRDRPSHTAAAHSQQEEDVARTREPFCALGFSSRSLGSLLMPSPQGVHVLALGSEYITQPSLKLPTVHWVMPEAARK